MSSNTVDSTHDPRAPSLRTLVVCDLVGSTALVDELGDLRAALLVQRHDRLARDLVAACHGREIDKTDGFLIVFDRAVHAVEFALRYLEQLGALAVRERVELAARVGVHVGEVIEWRNTPGDIAQGAKPVEIEGIAKPVAARLMNMAGPGQVLVSGVAQSLARRAQDELGALARRIVWREHGNFGLKGVAEPIIVWEVADRGAPMRALPENGADAKRLLPWWRRRPFRIGMLAIVVMLLALLAIAIREPPPPEPVAFAARDWVALGDVRDLTAIEGIGTSVAGALRIALEQSTHVSLIGAVAQREALVRMGRDRSAPIDRTTGAALALREGAALLVLPTVADRGGRLRVTLELVDPASETTVHTLTADAVSADDLPVRVDLLVARLHGWLGEDQGAIRPDPRPLARVATSNLDALRAYTLAIEAEAALAPQQAEQLLARAIELDPAFSRARIALAALQLRAGDAGAFDATLSGLVEVGRALEPRERMLVDALKAEAHAPAEAAGRWAALVAMYPDTADARKALVQSLWHYDGRLDEARARAREGGTARGAGMVAVPAHALLDAAAGENEAALAALQIDETRSFERILVEAQVRIAGGASVEAADLLQRLRSIPAAGGDLALREADALLLVGSGSLGKLVAAESSLWRDRIDRPQPELAGEAALAAQLRLVVGLRGQEGIAELGSLLGPQEVAVHAAPNGAARLDHAAALALVGLASARLGDDVGAVAVLGLLDTVPDQIRTGCLADLRDALALARGRAPRRAGTIESWAAAGREGGSIQWRYALLARARSEGRADLALAVAGPLAADAGRAIAEQCGSIPLRLINLHDVRMAALEAAEVAVETDPGQAPAFLRRFLSDWPETQLSPALAQRVQRVRAEALRRGG